MLNSLSKCSSVTAPKGTNSPTPALAKTISIRPFHLGNGLAKTIKVGEFGNVALNSRNVGTDCLYGLVEFLLSATRNEDIGTLSDEKFCRSQPDAFCAAGDDSDLAFELFEHCFSLLLPSSNELSGL
jgi:hypothetical protein